MGGTIVQNKIAMKQSFILLFFILISACDSEPRPSFDRIQTNFVKTINQNKKGAAYYWRQGALFVRNKIYKSRDSIHQQLQQLPTIDTTFSIAIVKHDSSNYFDIGYYQLQDSAQSKWVYMVAWKEEKGKWCKELEVLYPLNIAHKTEHQRIDAVRQAWENYSNQHQPDSLVEQLYDAHGFYLNDGYIYKGRKAIETKYAYMLKEQWHIRLSSIQTIQVSDSLFYDVGQYVSSGKGHYFILWQLQSDGKWQVLLDFNF